MQKAAYPYKLDPLRDNCPINAAIHVIRGRWKACILYELSEGPRRFTEIQKAFPGVATQALSMQLRQMEADGLINRTVIEERPVRVDYRLTSDGGSLMEILAPLKGWGQVYLDRQAAAGNDGNDSRPA